MSEDRFTRLTVIDRPSGKISTDGSTDHHGAGKAVIGAPAQGRKLVPDLHHRRPDVVEKLNFHNGLESSRSHTHRTSDNAGLGKLRVEAARAPKLPLQPVRNF